VRRSHGEDETGQVTEMAIVNTFTKLIFGDQGFTDRESEIIAALRSVRPEVLRDSYGDIGEYLRGLGVREMIQLVSRVRQQCDAPGDNPEPRAEQFVAGVQTGPADRTHGNS